MNSLIKIFNNFSFQNIFCCEKITNCSLCLETFKKTDLKIVLKCNHIIHFDCLETFSNQNKKCSLCKIQLSLKKKTNPLVRKYQDTIKQNETKIFILAIFLWLPIICFLLLMIYDLLFK